MKKINFFKMSGSGNDFVVVDNRRRVINAGASALAERLCHRQKGIGADGLLLLEHSERAQFRMIYFNSDGSRATMCGNGARCIAWVADRQGISRSKFDFETDAGIVQALVKKEIVQITMSDPYDYVPERSIQVGDKVVRVACVTMGVPHAVVFVPEAKNLDVARLGRLIRFHKTFSPKGTNVNFVQIVSRYHLIVRTYERGVEGETLACGTGVCASALVAALRGKADSKVRCKTTGGDALEVGFTLFSGNAQHPATQVTLKGPVRLSFSGQVEI